ncbi:MAG: HAMP domain-containing sensor histidine kinase [Desulfobacteraceae bacterium]|jgi:signal transduction histidine kinase
MKTSRTILIYWFLLIVPTLVIGVWALKLLSHEKDRLKIQAVASLTERARTMADSLEFTVADVEEALTRSLLTVDKSRIEPTLSHWQETNPLVRNVFIWNENRLIYPVDGLAATPEERRFAIRYEALFTGRLAFGFGNGVSSDEWNSPVVQVEKSYQSNAKAKSSARKDLLSLARLENQDQTATAPSESYGGKPLFKPRSGWIPWFSENRLFILGYAQREEKGPVYGLELELMTLLSRLITQLPQVKESYAAFGLVSGDDELVFQAGGFPIDVKKKPEISVPLSDLLPHYRVNVYLSEKGAPGETGFIYVSALLVLVFLAAMILGGTLLIRDSRRSMKDAMEKTSFVSSVSHELKTPLTSIRMYAELLAEGRVSQPEKVNRYLSVIVSESQRLTRLVNNVLDFGRLEQGKKTYHKASLDMAEFVRGIFDAHSIRIAAAGLSLELHIPENAILIIVTDRDALEQVLLNLIDNAVKYAASGKYLGCSVENNSNDTIDLVITDRGPGIPPAHQTLIFEKFHRVDNSLTAEQAGSGLGLSIARRILRDLGGDLIFEPEKDGGSRFIARIGKS